MSCENTKYAVVKFLSDLTHSEIPTAWLYENEDSYWCWWPPRTANCATLISNCTSPNLNTWIKYEIDIIKYCTSLESARKNAADANYNTTDKERLGRGKRPHISNSRFHNDEEHRQVQKYPKKRQTSTSTTSTTNPTLPLCPSNFDLILESDIKVNESGYNENHILKNEENDQQSQEQNSNLSNIPVIIQEYNTESVAGDLKESIEQMMRMQAAANITLRNMEKRLLKIESAIKQRTRSPDTINDNLIAPFLPLSSIKIIKDFDEFLKTSNEAVIQFKEFMSKSGGHNAKDNIHRILSKTITNECAIKCSWKGLRNNFRVSNLHFIKIMKREVTSRYTMLTETDFDDVTAEWIRFANQRNKRERAKENVDEDNNERTNK